MKLCIFCSGYFGDLRGKIYQSKFRDIDKRHGNKEIIRKREKESEKGNEGEAEKDLEPAADTNELYEEGDDFSVDFTFVERILLSVMWIGGCCICSCCRKRKRRLENNIKLDLAFKNLALELKGSGKFVLSGVSGILEHSKVTAVMGLSGCGKTSFITTLAGKAYYGKSSGDILVNGSRIGLNELKKLICFFPQEDVMLRIATVEETLSFSARTRLPDSWKGSEKARVVHKVIERLGLVDVIGQLIGDEKKRGISGGQRKRVNIGMELVADPVILFLDEPTSGLDSTSSREVCDALKGLARDKGMNIITVVHQPRWDIFKQFDNLLLLARGGYTIYCGSIDGAEEYFNELGFFVPDRVNPADFYLDCVSGQVVNRSDGKLWDDSKFVDEWSRRRLPEIEKNIDNMLKGSEEQENAMQFLLNTVKKKIKDIQHIEEGVNSANSSINNTDTESLGDSFDESMDESMEEGETDNEIAEEEGGGETHDIEIEGTVGGSGEVEDNVEEEREREIVDERNIEIIDLEKKEKDEELKEKRKNQKRKEKRLEKKRVRVEERRKRIEERKKLREQKQRERKRRKITKKVIQEVIHLRSVSLWTQFRHSFYRSWILRLRNLKGFYTDNLMMVIGWMILGFLNMGLTIDPGKIYAQGAMLTMIIALCGVMGSLPTFGENKVVFIREEASGLRAIIHYISMNIVDLMNIIICPFVFVIIVFFMATPQGNFGMYYLVAVSIHFATYGLGYNISIFFNTGNEKIAAVVIVIAMNLFGGILRNLKGMEEQWPIPVKFFPYVCYPLYGIGCYFVWEIKAFVDIFDEEKVLEDSGYSMDWGYFGFVVIFGFGIVFRITGFILLKSYPPNSYYHEVENLVRVKISFIRNYIGGMIYWFFNVLTKPCRIRFNVKKVDYQIDDDSVHQDVDRVMNDIMKNTGLSTKETREDVVDSSDSGKSSSEDSI